MNEIPPNQYTPSAPKANQEEKALKKECEKILQGKNLQDKIRIPFSAAFKKHLKDFLKIERHPPLEPEKPKKTHKKK